MVGLQWVAVQIPQEGKDFTQDFGCSGMKSGSKTKKRIQKLITQYTGNSAWLRLGGRERERGRPEDPERRQLAGSGDGWKREWEGRKLSVAQPWGSWRFPQGRMTGKGLAHFKGWKEIQIRVLP